MNAPAVLDGIAATPLIGLRHIGRELPVPVLVKCEHLNPGGSIKDRLAKAAWCQATCTPTPAMVPSACPTTTALP